MSEIKDGGPAFPVPGLQHDEEFNGMSLRDHFAATADLHGIIEHDGCIEQRLAVNLMGCQPPDWDTEYIAAHVWWFEAEARIRYMKADAMLRARGQS